MTHAHRSHLERRPTDYGTAARAVCDCGWAGRWYATGARATEEGTTHTQGGTTT